MNIVNNVDFDETQSDHHTVQEFEMARKKPRLKPKAFTGQVVAEPFKKAFTENNAESSKKAFTDNDEPFKKAFAENNEGKIIVYARVDMVYGLALIVTGLKALIPPQHSDYWYNMRRYRVGASEIATFIGLAQYDSIENKIREKVNATRVVCKPKFIGEACVWGNILEDVIRKHCEDIYNTVIHEVGSIPNLPGQAMSPDGLSIVGDEVVLWEYKCPFMRELTPDMMPDYYIPQVLTGLETLPFCDYALFMETIIRRAPIHVNGPTAYYDKYFPFCANMKIPPFKWPITWGAISFMSKLPATRFGQINPDKPGANLFKFLVNQSASKPIDFGSCPGRQIRDLLELFAEGFIEAHYIYQQHPDETEKFQIDEYSADSIWAEAMCVAAEDNRHLFGVMRWKMIQKNVIKINRRPGYLLATNKYARAVNECVKMCDLIDDEKTREIKIHDTATILRKMFANDPSVHITEPFAKKHVPKNKK